MYLIHNNFYTTFTVESYVVLESYTLNTMHNRSVNKTYIYILPNQVILNNYEPKVKVGYVFNK